MSKGLIPTNVLSMIPADKLEKMTPEKRKELEHYISEVNAMDLKMEAEFKDKKILLFGYKSFRYAANKFIQLIIKVGMKK